MARVKLKEMCTGMFLKAIKERTGFSYTKLAGVCGVHRRSFSDWGNGKTLMPDHVFQKLTKLGKMQPDFEVMPDYWYIQKAGKSGFSIWKNWVCRAVIRCISK